MATFALKMESNPFFEVLMERLELNWKRRSKQVLACLQLLAVYYACLGVKRSCSTYSQDVRNKKACESYKEFVVPSFMRWMEEHDHKLPSWVTPDLLGKSTLGGPPKLYNGNLKALWTKFSESQRVMRMHHTPIYDSLLVGGQLPSGNQVEDIAIKFNEELWKLQPGSKKVVKVEASESTVEGVEEGSPRDCDGKGGATHYEDINMPEDYVNELALTFAIFGRPSPSPDHDLALAPNSGPKKKKRRSEGIKLEEDDGRDGDLDNDENSGARASTLSRRAIKMMVDAGESQSRGDARNFAAKEITAGATLSSRKEVVDLLKNPPQDIQQAKMVAAVENISHMLQQKQAHEQRKHEVLNLQGEINMLISLGLEEEATTARRKLLVLFRTPVTAPVMPTPTAPVAEPAVAGTSALDVSGANDPPPNGAGGDGAPAETPALDVSGFNDPLPYGTGGDGARAETPALDVSGMNAPLPNGTGGEGARAETPALDVSGINDALHNGTGGDGARAETPALDVSGTNDALPNGYGIYSALQRIDGNVAGWSGGAGGQVSI